jgi:formylglycine-generating enzyme required for sulfatase activity
MINLEMVEIPSGTFLMGSEKRNSEKPQHQVTVKSFSMGKYPVTQAQWEVVAQMPKVSRELIVNPSYFEGYLRPVEQVSWNDAVEFCQRLSAHTGRTYRLPSEAEWEYACRAGTTTPFAFGKTLTTDAANYNGDYTYNDGPKGEYRERTTIVGRFPANSFGLYDMHGNVDEWCADHWHDNYEGAPTDGSAWLTDDETSNRILRGGSWTYYHRDCRSASRACSWPDDRIFNIGFRIVMD